MKQQQFSESLFDHPRRLVAAAWVLCAVAAFAVYGPARDYPFLLDDIFHYLENPTVQSWGSLTRVWTTNYWEDQGPSGLYRPLLKTLWLAQILLFGGRHASVVWINLIFHALNAALVAGLARRAGADGRIAIAAGLWFALHPAHVEVALTAVGQGETFSLALALGALWLVFPDSDSSPLDDSASVRRFSIPLAGFCVLLAASALIKEQGYAACLLGAAALALNPGIARRAKRTALGALGCIVAAWIALRLVVLGGFGPPPEFQIAGDLGIVERLILGASLFGRYLTLAAAPLRLGPDYIWLKFHVPVAWSDVYLWLGLIAGGGAVAGLARAWKTRASAALICGLATLLPLAPFLGLTAIGTLFAERHAYHYLAGAALIIALGLNGIVRRLGAPRLAAKRAAWIATATLVLWSALLGARAGMQRRHWASGLQLWEATWRAYPESYFAASTLAYYQLKQARFAEARANSEAALALDPEFPHAHLNLGELNLRDGRPDDAIRHLIAAQREPRNFARAQAGVIFAEVQRGDITRARQLLDALRNSHPSLPILGDLEAMVANAERQRGETPENSRAEPPRAN